MKLFSLLLIIALSNIVLFGQTNNTPKAIKWYSIKEALELNKTTPKKIFIDVYTDWCGWCKVMDKNTFTDPNIIQYMSDNYYAVKFNAEGKDTIEYLGKKYFNKETGTKSAHDLAIFLLRGQLSYPNIVYLDENSNAITAIAGYRKPTELLPFLIYFNKDIYKTTNLDDFQKYFNKTYYDTTSSKDSIKIKWYSLNEAVELNKTKPKKIFIDFYYDWCIECKIMYKTTYYNPVIANYLNNDYYPVHFDVLSKDTVNIFGNKYINEGTTHPYHQLPVSLLQGKMVLPTLIYINDDMTLITNIQGYMSPQNFEPILEFIKSNAFKTEKWEDFRKNFKSKIQ